MTPPSRSRRLSLGAVLGAAALALTACAQETPPPAPSASATPSPSPSASAPPVDGRPAITDLVLTTEGLGAGGPGDLVLGAKPSVANPSTDLVTFVADACAGTGLPDPSLWIANYPESDEGFGPEAPFAIGVQNDVLTRIDVNTPNIITDEGLTLGSSIDAVLGIYPGGPDEVVNHADVSDVYVLSGEKGKLMFEIAVDRIPGYWEADAINTVVFLSAVSIDTPAYGVAATDNKVGICNVA
jgi:hypothetical protein